MKIAVVMAGQMRNVEHTVNSFENIFCDHEKDFFVHTWESTKYEEEYLSDLLRPKKMIIEPQVDFHKIVGDLNTFNLKYENNRSTDYIFNTLSHFYSLREGIRLVPLEEYDYVLRIRSDTLLLGELGDFHIEKAKNGSLLMNYSGVAYVKGLMGNDIDPGSINNQTTIVGDCILFGKSNTMKSVLGSLYEDTVFQVGEPEEHSKNFTSEVCFREVLWTKGIAYRHVPMPYILARNNYQPGMDYGQYIKTFPPWEQVMAVRNNPQLFGVRL